jgi:ATP-dependent protease HslVU (ClpYQ) peptidase subunit
MTCIVGLVANGKVHIGADSAGVSGWSLSIRSDRKVFKNGPLLIGFTTSFRMGQLLQYSLKPPVRHPDRAIMEFMVVDFVDAVRNCLKIGGFARRENEVENAGQFLVGYEGRLFSIDSDYQVNETVDGYAACGCGNEIALGAIFATNHLPPDERLRIALEAAERFSAGVRGPFHFESI